MHRRRAQRGPLVAKDPSRFHRHPQSPAPARAGSGHRRPDVPPSALVADSRTVAKGPPNPGQEAETSWRRACRGLSPKRRHWAAAARARQLLRFQKSLIGSAPYDRIRASGEVVSAGRSRDSGTAPKSVTIERDRQSRSDAIIGHHRPKTALYLQRDALACPLANQPPADRCCCDFCPRAS